MHDAPSTGAPGPSTPMSERARRLALYVLCLGMLMIVLDVTVVNVALPVIQDDLHFTASGLAWVVNAYLISFGGLLLLAGRLGDLVGRKVLFMAGLGLFTAASVACGASVTQEMLIAARFVQGIGGAMASAVILGMIVTMYAEPREQAKAIGVYAFVASSGGSVGLVLGGLLAESINWHWIFFVNLPIGVVALAAGARLLPRDEGLGLREGADVPGAVLSTVALMLGVYTIVVPAAEHGWTDARTLALGGVSLALLAAFVLRERHAAHPLIPLRIFRSRNVSGANVVQVLSVAGMFGMFFLGSLYLQRVLGYDSLSIGLAFLPTTVVMGTLSLRYSERLITRFGARTMLLFGTALMAAGLALFTRAPLHGGYVEHVLPVMVLLGIGAGTSFPALTMLAMSGVDPHEAGLASGLVNTAAEVGGALGLAVLATLSASRTEHLQSQGRPELSALLGGYHLAFWVATGLVVAAVAVGAVVLQPPQAPEVAAAGELADESDVSLA